MPLPIRPAVPALAGLQALMERQRHALMEGNADELAALGAQLKVQVAQIRHAAHRAEGPPRNEAARAELEQLNQLAMTNLELLQRRLVETQSSMEALGPGVALLEETRARMTYESAGRMDTLPASGRPLGQA
jgi:hypothetical protein